MTLKSYLKENGESANVFSKRSTCPRTVVMRAYHGLLPLPNLTNSRLIVRACGGLVTYEDIYQAPRRKKSRAKRSSAA